MCDGLIVALLMYVSAQSGLPAPQGACPDVKKLAAFEGHRLGRGGSYEGITSRIDGRIGLRAGWRPNAGGICLLAHELVHYLQFVNGMIGDSSRNEPPAYGVMADCYERAGLAADAAYAQAEAARYRHLAD